MLFIFISQHTGSFIQTDFGHLIGSWSKAYQGRTSSPLKDIMTSAANKATSLTVCSCSSKVGFTSDISKLVKFSFPAMCLSKVRTVFGSSPNGDGALTPGASEEVMESVHNVIMMKSCFSVKSSIV